MHIILCSIVPKQIIRSNEYKMRREYDSGSQNKVALFYVLLYSYSPPLFCLPLQYQGPAHWPMS